MRFLILLVMVAGCDKAKDEKLTPAPTPTPAPAPAPADAATAVTQTACDAVLIFLETGGTWIGAPPSVSCFSDNTLGKERDLPWLKNELRVLHIKLGDCKPVLEVAAANGVSYQELITVMDTGMSIGFLDVELANPNDLSMKFTATKQPKCSGPLATTPTPGAGSAKPAGRLSTLPADLKTSPLIIVTRETIKLGDEEIISVADAMKESNKLPIPELQRAIPAAAKQVILQADGRVDAKVINRILKSTTAAGVENMLFAIKNR
jgi:biopolymer transport protein ExbD